MRARHIPLSPLRRMILDFTHFAVPSVVLQRHMQIGEVVAARAACQERPSWLAIFLKAFAITADEFRQLRQVYVKLPWPHIAEYATSMAAVAVEREHLGQLQPLMTRLRDPMTVPLSALNSEIRRAASIPIEESRDFRRAVSLGRLPWILRRPLWWFGLNVSRQRARLFGTFCISVSAPFGAEGLHPIGPYTTILNYGPIGADGGVNVRFVVDHRVIDGAMVARAMVRMEEILNTTVLAELKSLPPLQVQA